MFHIYFFFLMIRRPPRSTQSRSSAASDVYKRQVPAPQIVTPNAQNSQTANLQTLSTPTHQHHAQPILQQQQQQQPPQQVRQQQLGFDPMEKVRNLSNLVHECHALAGNELAPGTKILDVDSFTRMYSQLKGDLEKVSKENQRLSKAAEVRKGEADEATGRLKKMEGKTLEWIKLEREFADILPRVDAVQRRYGEALSRQATMHEEYYEKVGEYFKKTLAYEEKLYLKDKELQQLAEIDREDLDQRFAAAGQETTDDEESIGRGTNAAKTAAMTVISMINGFFSEHEAELKANEQLHKKFADLIINLNDEHFLTKLSAKVQENHQPRTTAKTATPTVNDDGSGQLARLQALLTEINAATLSFEAMFDAFRRAKDENASNVNAFVGFARDLTTTLATNKIAHDIEAERSREAAKALREAITRAEFAENMNVKLTTQHEEVIAKMNHFARESTANHERQVNNLRENYERSINDLMNLNNTVQASLVTTKSERDQFENRSLELASLLESANNTAEDLRSKLATRENEKAQLETKHNALVDHNKSLLERLQHLNNENLVLHNKIVSINQVTGGR
eukprot:TRINITY_DN4490_c0_g1_i4.p1 TRINITY_DN4490_c0_g1~~TRINITY_DN4490_c0_g1_i4.p1  ORF type:complete len:570 (-),score=165.33 TRINITY_DN4490_c0_g1_i4:123-1832(-)